MDSNGDSFNKKKIVKTMYFWTYIELNISYVCCRRAHTHLKSVWL